MKDDPGNASKLLGKTGYYDPNSMEIHIFTTGRHPKDILRSIAHELVHHMQNDKGELEQGGYSGQGYAQKTHIYETWKNKLTRWETYVFETGKMA